MASVFFAILREFSTPDNSLATPIAGIIAIKIRTNSDKSQMAKPKKSKTPPGTIAVNRKARHDFFIEDTLEAGIVLHGWEVKSLRAGKAQLAESYVQLRGTHVKPEPARSRKLLLHRTEIDRLVGAVDRKGYTIVPLDLHWKGGNAKLTIGYAKGKKQHDKRADAKDRDWQRQKSRILKHG